jgi:hypothetical protein
MLNIGLKGNSTTGVVSSIWVRIDFDEITEPSKQMLPFCGGTADHEHNEYKQS